MKILYITYYFPPDYGAGSFRSQSLINTLKKKIKKTDELHIITTKPNRYHSIKRKISPGAKNLFIHEIELLNHKEKLFLKSLSGFIYFYKSIYEIIKIKPNFIISSSARLVSGLIAFISAKILKVNYILDLRDLFSSFLKNYSSQKKILKVFVPLFSLIEKIIVKNSSSTNFVSPGFYNYFLKKNIIIKDYTTFTNGIDEIFVEKKINKIKKNKKKTILYAGNIGLGQGLEKIIPGLANINKNIEFIIIGDGGMINKLKNENLYKGNKNVKILKPMNRKKLIKYYQKSDILFLHLNNFETFKYNLPSKIYEYSVFNKPVLAGIEGYSKKYCIKNFNNFFFFKSGNVAECNKVLNKMINLRQNFKVNKTLYRKNIMNKYALHIMDIIENSN